MNRYQIIDEPKSKSWAEHLIVDPTIILFAAILVPLIWLPPGLMRFWLPMLWIAFNGYALGSATLKTEIGILVAGALVWFLVNFAVLRLLSHGVLPFEAADVSPYLRIITFGIFFFTLYSAIFRQGASYALHSYLKDGSA